MEVKIEQNVKKVSSKKITYKHKMNKGERAALWGKRIFLWISILIIIFPVFAIVTASLSPGTSFMQKSLIPKEISLVNYKVVLSAKDGFLKWMLNTTFVALAVSTIQLIMTMPAAYAFSKMRFTGRKNGLMTLLILQMFPSSMAVPAILAIAYKVPFGMDNLWFLVLVLCAGSAYNIWLMKGFIDGLPQALDEAAMVDGATTWQVFTKIILPLSKPMAVVIFFFSFICVFGEFVFSAALIKEKSLKLLVPGLKSLMVDKVTNWPQYAAASILISIPLAIVFVCIQKFITRGLVAGSIKE
ncbi:MULTISPECIES: sugar ABC transporter permease [Clostridium]|uniref:ABC transporter permease subunit n=1 Tax=Clostridium paridis TaxID=2803863 RepID=A0A937FJ25_9CLOT|nr:MULTISPECIES: ABC transporter permease subunit [Clostridium]MBL4933112.1 ABC transporter permease subunit [Clostridium paridis]